MNEIGEFKVNITINYNELKNTFEITREYNGEKIKGNGITMKQAVNNLYDKENELGLLGYYIHTD